MFHCTTDTEQGSQARLSSPIVLCRQLGGTGDGEALLALGAASPGLDVERAEFLLLTFKLLGIVFLRGHN